MRFVFKMCQLAIVNILFKPFTYWGYKSGSMFHAQLN